MKVEVLYFEGCPNHAPTVEKVREALQSDYQSAEIREVEVRTQAEAESLGFLGSPSVRINGLDVEPEARSLKSYGLSCRTYLEGAIRSGVPSRFVARSLNRGNICLAGMDSNRTSLVAKAVPKVLPRQPQVLVALPKCDPAALHCSPEG